MGKLLIALLLCVANLAHAATEISGVKFADKTKLGAAELQLNGAGQRSRLFFKVYAIGLYLPEKRTAVADVLALKGPKRLHIVTLRELTAEQFGDALAEGIQRNHTDAEMAALKTRIEDFKLAMLAMKKTAEGSVVDIDWLPESGTRLIVGGKQQGKDIPGEDFYNALLMIWLGPKPAQDDLKEALLGKVQ